MLEKGTRKDKYDFLELYFRGWEKVAEKIERQCFPDEVVANVEIEDEPDTGDQTVADNSGLDEKDVDEDNGEEDTAVGELEVQKAYPLHNPRFRDDTSVPQLLSKDYYKRQWHPYDWYVKVNTEYYFRYEGSMPEPPCFEGVHWRVLRKPIKVSPGQLRRLRNLLSNRLNPLTCEKETAGKPQSPESNKVLVNRPIQTMTRRHKFVYCECADWLPKSLEDRSYCNISES